MMKCACCGRRKKLGESFEDLGKGGAVCVDCSDLMYRIHDAYVEKEEEEYERQVEAVCAFIKNAKASDAFAAWFENDFMKRNR